MLFSVPAPHLHWSSFAVAERHLRKFNETADREQAISETMSLWEKIKDYFSDGVYKQALGCLYDLVQAKNIINNPETSVDRRTEQIKLAQGYLILLEKLAPDQNEMFRFKVDDSTGFITFHFGKVKNEPLLSFPMQEFTDVRAAKCWESIDGYFDKGNKTQAKTILNSLFHPKYTYQERIAKFAELARLANAGAQPIFRIACIGSVEPGYINISFQIIGSDDSVMAVPGGGRCDPKKVRQALVRNEVNPVQLRNNSTKAPEGDNPSALVERFVQTTQEKLASMASMMATWERIKDWYSEDQRETAFIEFRRVFKEEGTFTENIRSFAILAHLTQEQYREHFQFSVTDPDVAGGEPSEKISVKLMVGQTSLITNVDDVHEVAGPIMGVDVDPKELQTETSKAERSFIKKIIIAMSNLDDATLATGNVVRAQALYSTLAGDLQALYRPTEDLNSAPVQLQDKYLSQSDGNKFTGKLARKLFYAGARQDGVVSMFSNMGFARSKDGKLQIKIAHPFITICKSAPFNIFQNVKRAISLGSDIADIELFVLTPTTQFYEATKKSYATFQTHKDTFSATLEEIYRDHGSLLISINGHTRNYLFSPPPPPEEAP